MLDELDGDYDLAILDCAPSISLVSESVFSAADLLLVPIVPSTLSVRTFEQLQGFLAQSGEPAPAVLAFLSMVDRRKKLHRELTESLPATLPAVSDTAIPSASVVELMGLRRAPVVATLPRSPAAKAYVALWERVRDTLDALPEPLGGSARSSARAGMPFCSSKPRVGLGEPHGVQRPRRRPRGRRPRPSASVCARVPPCPSEAST